METPSQPARLSIVIPSYNSRRTIDLCLDALKTAAARPGVEVILVDSSTDGTDAHVRERYPFVRVIHLDKQTWPGPGRNIGAKAAAADLLAFTDTDCVVAPDWADAILESFARHPEQDACVGIVRNHNPRGAVSWVSFLTEFNGYLGGARRPTRHLPSFSTAFRRAAFEKAGGFPEDVAWLEDMILTEALLRMGAKLYVEPAIRIAHHNRDRLREFLRHQYHLGRFFAHSRFRGNLPGSRALRATAFSIPALAAWRALRALERTFRARPAWGLLLLLLSPLYLAGMIAWMAGVRLGRRDCA